MFYHSTQNTLIDYDNSDDVQQRGETIVDPGEIPDFNRGVRNETSPPEAAQPTLRADIRLLGQEQHVDHYHNDNHHDIYEVAFCFELPEGKKSFDGSDVSEQKFYATIKKFEDVVIETVNIDKTAAWHVHVFRSIDIAPGYHPTEFDRPLSAPFAINHPKIASVGGASRQSMSFIVIVEARHATKLANELPDYTVSIKLGGKLAGDQTISLTRL